MLYLLAHWYYLCDDFKIIIEPIGVIWRLTGPRLFSPHYGPNLHVKPFSLPAFLLSLSIVWCISNIIFEAIGVTWRLTDPRLRSVIVKNWVQFSKLRGIFTILYWPLYYHSAGKRDRGKTQAQRGWVCPREGGEAPKKVEMKKVEKEVEMKKL